MASYLLCIATHFAYHTAMIQHGTSWLEVHVTILAEWSCLQVLEDVRAHGDSENWVASYDGFFLTRGHHSNNSLATLHDYSTVKIAYF